MVDIDAAIEYIQQQGFRCYVIYRAVIIYSYAQGEKWSFSLSFNAKYGLECAKMQVDDAIYFIHKAIQKRATAR